MAGDKDPISELWQFFLKVVALVVYYLFVRTFEVVRELARPFLGYFIDIYATIDVANLDPLYVLQAFLKWALMVTLYIWQWLKWLTDKIIGIIPGGRWLLAEISKIMDQVDYEYRFLLRPLNLGLFSRK